jgi:hypothetical protein
MLALISESKKKKKMFRETITVDAQNAPSAIKQQCFKKYGFHCLGCDGTRHTTHHSSDREAARQKFVLD